MHPAIQDPLEPGIRNTLNLLALLRSGGTVSAPCALPGNWCARGEEEDAALQLQGGPRHAGDGTDTIGETVTPET